MLTITEKYSLYYYKDTGVFDDFPISEIGRKNLSPDKLLPLGGDENNVKLPTYEEIDHKEIMSFYVKESIEDKELRKQLFYILRRSSYLSAFINKLQELELYEEFIAVCGDVYIRIFDVWAEANSLDFRRK